MSKARFELKKTKSNQFHFNWVAANNKVVMTSETYTTEGNARKAIKNLAKTFLKTLKINGKLRVVFIEEEII